MADGYIQVPPDSTGKKVDTDELTVGANTVERQRFRIAGTAAADIAPVDATNGLAVDNKTLAPDAATETTLAELSAQALDYDTGGGSAPQVIFGLALPANGGPVAGGTSTNPIQVSLANTGANATAVNIQDGGNSITVDYATTGSGTAAGAIRVELPTNGTGVIATVGAVTAITNALPAGTNAIGKLAANSGVDIGDVDILSIAAGSNLIGYVGRKFTVGNANTLTTTNFSGLTNTSGWQSAAISPTGAADIIFSFTTVGAAGSTALVDFYVAESNGTTYSDAATGSEGTFTAANRKNARYLGSLQLNTTNSVTGEMRLSDVMLSPNSSIALIAINNSGGTISATGGNTVFTYQLVY